MTPKRWIESTNAVGIVSKAGLLEGTGKTTRHIK
jgi:hypothetical protein